jgi:tryptophan synthase alpha chain
MSQLQTFIDTRHQQLASQYGHNVPLAMTHVIYGYPTLDASLEWMRALLSLGVDILEVQFPFSDPVADGPTIVEACHVALSAPLQLLSCLQALGTLQQEFPQSKIVLISYLNPIYRCGFETFVAAAAAARLAGIVIPDLPIEQAKTYQAACQRHAVDPIWLITPNTPAHRQQQIAEQASGMLYCVSRAGVTGQKAESAPLADYLQHIRRHTNVPLAVGFGIHSAAQVEALRDIAQVAVIGSALLEAFQREGQASALVWLQARFAHLQ